MYEDRTPAVRDVEEAPPAASHPLPVPDDSALGRFVRRRGALVVLVAVVVAILVIYLVISITTTSPTR